MNTMMTIVLTALLSSIITLTILFLVAKFLVIPKVTQWIDETLLPEFRAQVKHGAIDSGETLLPQFRVNVREGFNDAIRAQMAGQIFEDAAKNVTKKMEAGLGSLFGRKTD